MLAGLQALKSSTATIRSADAKISRNPSELTALPKPSPDQMCERFWTLPRKSSSSETGAPRSRSEG